MNRLRLEWATEQFLQMLNRERVRRGAVVGSRTLQDYSPEDRSSLMRAVGAALKSAQPSFDKGFEDWSAKRAPAEAE